MNDDDFFNRTIQIMKQNPNEFDNIKFKSQDMILQDEFYPLVDKFVELLYNKNDLNEFEKLLEKLALSSKKSQENILNAFKMHDLPSILCEMLHHSPNEKCFKLSLILSVNLAFENEAFVNQLTSTDIYKFLFPFLSQNDLEIIENVSILFLNSIYISTSFIDYFLQNFFIDLNRVFYLLDQQMHAVEMELNADNFLKLKFFKSVMKHISNIFTIFFRPELKQNCEFLYSLFNSLTFMYQHCVYSPFLNAVQDMTNNTSIEMIHLLFKSDFPIFTKTIFLRYFKYKELIHHRKYVSRSNLILCLKTLVELIDHDPKNNHSRNHCFLKEKNDERILKHLKDLLTINDERYEEEIILTIKIFTLYVKYRKDKGVTKLSNYWIFSNYVDNESKYSFKKKMHLTNLCLTALSNCSVNQIDSFLKVGLLEKVLNNVDPINNIQYNLLNRILNNIVERMPIEKPYFDQRIFFYPFYEQLSNIYEEHTMNLSGMEYGDSLSLLLKQIEKYMSEMEPNNINDEGYLSDDDY